MNRIYYKVQKKIVNKRGDLLVTNQLNYLKRQDDVCLRVSNNSISDDYLKEYARNKNVIYYLLISTEQIYDFDLMQELTEECIYFIRTKNNLKVLNYVSYIHNDTDNSHFHCIIVPPLRKCHKKKKNEEDFDLSLSFCKNRLLPYLNLVLDNKLGEKTEGEYIHDYKNCVLKNTATRIDFDILKLSSPSNDINKPENRDKYIIFKDFSLQNKKIEEWKKPYILNRLDVLIEDGFAEKIVNENSNLTSYVLLKDFIKRKIFKGKVDYHLDKITKEESKKVIQKSIVGFRKEDVKEVISKKETGKHIFSYILKMMDGNLVYLEAKNRVSEKDMYKKDGTIKKQYLNSFSQGTFDLKK